jgi:branched-chain amino acid transport system permease protein
MILQIILCGIAVGSVYAILALGMVLIFKTTIVLNFAQGVMATMTTFIAYWVMVSLKLPYWAAVVGALSSGALLGILAERLIRPILNAPVLNMIGITIGMFFVVESLVGLKWGHLVVDFPNPFPAEPLSLKGLVVSPIQLGIIVVLLLLAGSLFAWLNFTTLGTSFRATCQDRFAAHLMGISSKRVYSISWASGCALGAVSGILIAPIATLSTGMMGGLLLKALAAAVLGGIFSLPGAIAGGITIGVAENIFGFYVSTGFKDTLAFLVIIVVLLVRPQGILGNPEDLKG